MSGKVTLLSNLEAYNHESITIDNTAGGVGFTSTVINPTANVGDTEYMAKRAFCTLESAQIRYTVDGTAPTTTIGHLLEVGQTLEIDNYQNIKTFRAIRTGSSSGTLMVTYFR